MIDKLFLMIKNFKRVVADDTLIDAFDNYISRIIVNEGSSEDTDHAIKLVDKMRSKWQGLSYDELEQLITKEPFFLKWYNAEGYELVLKTPKYVPYTMKGDTKSSVEDLSKLQGVKNRHERKKIRDNMLIDMITASITSPAGSQLALTPGSYKNVKHSSRICRILNNPNALANFIELYGSSAIFNYGGKAIEDKIDALEEFYEVNAIADDPLSVIDFANNHRNLMDGNDLIGIFAVNSSAHYKYQFINGGRGLKIHDLYKFSIRLPNMENSVTVNYIDSVVSPLTGERIGRICAEFQAASPDNGKDPCLGDLGANLNTAKRIGFLARIGCDIPTIGILNTCDDFRLAVENHIEHTEYANIPNNKWRDFDGDIEKIVEMIVEYRTSKSLHNIDIEYAAKFIGWMNNIDDLSQLLQMSNCISRCDSTNGALPISVAEVIQQRMKAQDFIEKTTRRNKETGKLEALPSSPILGFEQLLDIDLDAIYDDDIRNRILKSAVPRLQAAYTLGIKSAISMTGKYNLLPELSAGVMNAVGYLRSITKNNLSSAYSLQEIRKFIYELTMYELSGSNSPFGSDEKWDIMHKRNYFIHDFPLKFLSYITKKDKEGNLENEKFARKTVIEGTGVNAKYGIYFQHVGKVSPISRKFFTEELDNSLESEDPKEREIANDLFRYSYYANGLNFGIHNIGTFFSNLYYENMPKYLSVLKESNARLSSLTGVDENLMNYVNQFVFNHPSYAAIIKGYRISKYKFTTEGEDVFLEPNSTDPGHWNDIMANDTYETVPMVYVAGGKNPGMYLRMDIADTEGTGVKSKFKYKRVKFNTSKNPFYDKTKDITEIKYDELKDFIDPISPAFLNSEQKKMDKKESKKTSSTSKEAKMATYDESRDIQAPEEFEDENSQGKKYELSNSQAALASTDEGSYELSDKEASIMSIYDEKVSGDDNYSLNLDGLEGYFNDENTSTSYGDISESIAAKVAEAQKQQEKAEKDLEKYSKNNTEEKICKR